MMSFWVRLSGWSKAREVRVQDGYAYFEVAEQGHCGICQGRIRHIMSLDLNDMKTSYLHDRYPSDGKTLWAGVPVATDSTQDQIVQVLKERMQLPIL